MLIQPTPPVIVKLIEPPSDPTGLRDVLLGALGLTGLLTILALVAGVLFGAVILWIRRRSED